MKGQGAPSSTTSREGPRGLGGLLWLFALPLMLLPLLIVSLALAEIWSQPSWTWPIDIHSPILIVFHEYGILAVLLCSTLAAEAYFRRSPRFPALASALLMTWCLLGPLDSLALRPEPFDVRKLLDAVRQDDMQWFFALTAILYLRLSRRVRNTFDGAPVSSSRRGPARWLLEGPRDWSGGVWLIVGTLIGMLLYYATSIPGNIDESMLGLIFSEPPPPLPTASPGTVGALIAALTESEIAYARFARALLLQHALGAALALWAAFLFVRRSRRMGWAFAGSAALIATSGLTAVAADHLGADPGLCFDCQNAKIALPQMLTFAVLAIGALALPAVRRRAHPRSMMSRSET